MFELIFEYLNIFYTNTFSVLGFLKSLLQNIQLTADDATLTLSYKKLSLNFLTPAAPSDTTTDRP